MPGLAFERTETLVRDRRSFVYPLELSWDWSRTLTAGPRSMAPDIPSGVIASIQAGRASLLVFLIEAVPLEPDQHSALWLFDRLQQFIRERELPPHRVWFVSCHVRANESFALWLQQRHLYEPEVFKFRAMQPCVSIVRALYRANEQGWDIQASWDRDDLTASVEKSPFSAAEFAARYVSVAEVRAERRGTALRPKRFLAMNRHPWPHRVYLAAYLQGRGDLDDSLVSFPAVPADYFEHFPAPVLEEFLRASWHKLQPKLPLVIDEGAPPSGGFAPDNLAKLKNGWPYRQSYFNITSETSVYPPAFHTEKVMKPILNLQPFILVAPPDTLRYLRAIGFRSFSRVIDETYDQPADLPIKLTRVFEQVERLAQLGAAEARDLYFECLPELEHNRAHLIEGPHQLELLWGELEAQLP
jgi:hypothetical protein